MHGVKLLPVCKVLLFTSTYQHFSVALSLNRIQAIKGMFIREFHTCFKLLLFVLVIHLFRLVLCEEMASVTLRCREVVQRQLGYAQLGGTRV